MQWLFMLFYIYLQTVDESHDIYKATYSAFWVRERRGTVLPHAAAKVNLVAVLLEGALQKRIIASLYKLSAVISIVCG